MAEALPALPVDLSDLAARAAEPLPSGLTAPIGLISQAGASGLASAPCQRHPRRWGPTSRLAQE